MSAIAICCFMICLAIVLSWFRVRADMFSPARVFAFVWALTIGLAELKMSRLQHAWSPESWLVLLLGPTAFLAGVFILYVLHLRAPLHPVAGIRIVWRSLPVVENRLFYAAAVLFVLFLVGYGSIIVSGREIPVFSARPGRARLAFQLFGVGLFLHNAVLIVLLTVIYHLKVPDKKLRKGALAAMSVLSVVMYGLTLQRFQIVMTAILCVMLLYYTTRHLRPRTLAVYLSLAAVFFLLISTVRSGQLFMYYLYVDSRMTFPPQFAVLTEPYMYFAMNVENFARGVDRLDQFSLGAFSFDFVGALTGLKHWIREYFGLVETPHLISGYNTYTFFWTYYRDFGVAGLACLSLLAGMIASSVYYAMRKRPTVQTITWYGICIFVMLFSFYLNPLTFLWFVYDLVVLALVLRLVVPRESSAQFLAGGGVTA